MLFRSQLGFVRTSDYVLFWMDSSDTAAPRVECRVSREALEDRVARDSSKSNGEILGPFNWYRTEIERVVIDKHARGLVEAAGYVLVATRDLN